MDHYKEYLIWRGDLAISKAQPFNEVDNLILCALSYVDLRPVIRNAADAAGADMASLPYTLTIREIAEELLRKNAVRSMIVGATEGDTEFVRQLGASERFGGIRVTDYVDILDCSSDLQFAAFTAHMPDGRAFVAFRGTDDSISGWKEDFMISYTKTGSQQRALDYVRRTIEVYPEEQLLVGGHSKGGNLSLYSTAMLTDAELMRINHVYTNDGPGFCRDVLDPGQLDRIQDITTRIIPQFSVIGRLFEPAIRRTIIAQSDGEDILQHDLATWGVAGGKLLTAEANEPTSIFIHETFAKWIESAAPGERQKFVDTLFSAMAEGGNETITQIADKGPAAIENVLVRVFGEDAVVRGVAAALPEKAVFGDTLETASRKAADTKEAIEKKDKWGILKGIGASGWPATAALLIAGIVCILLNDDLLNTVILVIIIGVTALEIGLTVMQLKSSGWNFTEQSTRIVICVIMIATASVCIVKEGALFILASALFGIVFLYAAVNSFIKAKARKKDGDPLFILNGIEAVAAGVCGGFILVAPQDTLAWYMFGVGVLLILDACVKSMLIIAQNLRK